MQSAEDRIWEIARGFQPSRILLTAAELGVFEALGSGQKTSADVAGRLGTDPRATDRLLNALVALGLLAKDGELFSNLPEGRDLLVPGGPRYMGGALGHACNMWESWSTMTEAVRAGTSVLRREGQERADWVRPFIAAMDYNARERAKEIVKLINLDGVHRLLDVGGGSAAYAIEFCRAKPDLQAIVFDLPDVIPLTRQYIEKAGMSDRIGTAEGDYNVDELGGGFDMAFLSAIIHSNSPEQNIELFRKCFRALGNGGEIVVQDFIIEENRTAPAQAAIFALNMLVATEAGDTYTESEVKDWLSRASFERFRRIDPPGGGTVLLIGRKP